jgi:voltage-gated potassium channel
MVVKERIEVYEMLLIFTEAMGLVKSLLNDLRNKPIVIYLLTLALAVTIVSGFMLYVIDPDVHSLFDGIWSAWATITHVGFGDVVPTSFLGRLLSAMLILFGLVLFSLFTAILSVTLIGKDMSDWGLNVRQIEQNTSCIETEENKILHELERLHKRMSALEKKLSSSTEKDNK